MPSFSFQYFSHLSLEYCLIIIILEILVTALSDHPQAILFSRRPISLNNRSSKEVVFGAITPVFNQSSMFVNKRFERFSRYDVPCLYPFSRNVCMSSLISNLLVSYLLLTCSLSSSLRISKSPSGSSMPINCFILSALQQNLWVTVGWGRSPSV